MRKLLIALFVALGALVPIAYAQVVQNTITGKEVWVAAQGPGGPGNFIGIDTVRNGLSTNIATGSGAATSTAVGGVLMWNGTAPTTWAVTLPSPAFGGEEVILSTDTTLTSMVTVTAGGSNSLHASYTSQTLTALTPVIFFYKASTTTWYRIQ